MNAWNETRTYIRGLFPKFVPTPQESALVTRTLKDLPQDLVVAAADAYRCQETGVVFRLPDFLLVYYKRNPPVAKQLKENKYTVEHASETESNLEQERIATLARMSREPVEEVAHAIGSLCARKWYGGKPVLSEMNTWSRGTLFFVQAELLRLREESGVL